MTKSEKAKFVKELAKTILVKVVANIKSDKIPKSWEGKELRAYLADKFYESYSKFPLRGEQAGSYENDKVVNNL
jgi:hypothetical protein